MNDNIFEIFGEITLTDEQKKKIYENIVKNKTSSKKERGKTNFSYIKYASMWVAVFLLCFCVKNFYDMHNRTTKIYIGERNNIISEEKIKKELSEKEALKENSEEIVNEQKNDKQIFNHIILGSPQSEETQGADSIIVENEKTDENDKTPQTEEAFSDFSASYNSSESIEENKNASSSGGGAARIKSLSFEELMNNEKFGEYFPATFINGYSFSGAALKDDYAVAYYNSNFHSVTVTVNPLTDNSLYGKISIEREDYNGKYFNVPTEKYLISYFVSDKNCKNEDVYVMLHSAEYFKK